MNGHRSHSAVSPGTNLPVFAWHPSNHNRHPNISTTQEGMELLAPCEILLTLIHLYTWQCPSHQIGILAMVNGDLLKFFRWHRCLRRGWVWLGYGGGLLTCWGCIVEYGYMPSISPYIEAGGWAWPYGADGPVGTWLAYMLGFWR